MKLTPKITAIVSALALCVTAIVAPVTANAATGSTHWTSPCGAPYQANGNESFNQIAVKLLSPVSQLLRYSAKCGPDGNYAYDVQVYLNKGSLDATMPQGSRIWASDISVTR